MKTPTVPDSLSKALQRVFGIDCSKPDTFVRDGMAVPELVRLYELVRTHGCRSAIEVGMACGTSSVAICQAIQDNGGGLLVSVDPFQTSPDGYAGRGVGSVAAAGFSAIHRLLEQPNYLALPALLSEGTRCDFILIDGYHSLDYTLLDLFYAELLLRRGGVLAIHDTVWPSVYKATRFLERLKPYRRLSAPVLCRLSSPFARAFRRLWQWAGGPAAWEAARSRREHWLSIAAYEKLEDARPAEDHAVDF